MTIASKYFLIFAIMFNADVLWAVYIKWAAEGKAGLASIASVLIYIIGAFTFGEFIKDPYILIPAGLGCFLGTYITIVISHEKENPDPFFGSRIREALKILKKG